jgi:hypothetical protein
LTTPDAFTLLADLIPEDRGHSSQGVAAVSPTELIMSQDMASGTLLRLTRFLRIGKKWTVAGHCQIKGGHHGDFLQSYYGKPRWIMGAQTVAVPFVKGKTFAVSEIEAYEVSDAPLTLPRRGAWCQGEVKHGTGQAAIWIRGYGCPMKDNGPTYPKRFVESRLEVVKGGKVIAVIPLGHLGRGSNGKPIGGRLELEGLDRTRINGVWHLVINVNVGLRPHYHSLVYLWRIPSY